MIAPPKVLCSECQHENEPERVYCRDCGGRLDRSTVVIKKEPMKKTRQRVEKMFDPRRAKIRMWLSRTTKMVFGAIAVAGVIQMASPPDVPPVPKGIILISNVRSVLESALKYHRPPQVELNEEQLNDYVFSALRSKKSTLDKPYLEFKRAIIGLPEGACTVTVERSVFGYSVFSGETYSVAAQNGKPVTHLVAGSVGRMPIHPALMRYANIVLADVLKALDVEVKLLARFGAIQVHDKHVLLQASGS